ncbi:signal peptide protein, YSIRK family, partial [Gemella haemolysans]
MIGKNNKKLKDLKQGVKVESYSIKKFKFGAASIVIGASIFFGTGVASANEVAASSDSSATNDTNAKSRNGDKIPEKINTVSAEKENVASVNKPSSVKEESTKVEVEKKVVDKSLLETSITKLEELLATVNKDKAPASTLSAVNVDLINAKSILENANASQEEVDALVKKLKQQTQIVSSMPKVTTKEKEVKEGANTIANSGSRDSRNGKSMGEGTQFRAYTATSSSGAMKNVRYFASVDKNTNGGRNTRNDDPEFTERKTVVKSRYEQNSSGRWMVYDVYFNNNGIAMVDQSYGQHYYFQPPFNIMDPSNTVRDLTITRYQNVNQDPNKKLSDGGSGFQQVGNTVTITDPWNQKDKIFNGDRRSMYDPRSGVTRENQKWDVFKNNKNDSYLDSIVRKTDGNYTGRVSYTLGMEVGKVDSAYAIHMTARVKLRDNVTDQQAANGNVYAASVTSGPTTNQSYIVGSRGTSVKAEPDAPKDPIKGLTVTKTVGDYAGDPINPVSSGYVKHGKNGTFPPGMSWTWAGDRSPSTAQAGVFKYTSIATYQDGTKSTDAGSGSDGTVTLNVKPKKPTIITNVEHKKGLPNQQITVNVENGVPNGSTVKLYDGNRVIGTGTTNGQTATVTVTEALPGTPITAETVVTNANGTVTSDKSNPVTPTPKPDTQAPTLDVTPKEQTVKVGEKIKFNVNGQDDNKVNLDFSDIFKKYPNHLFTQKTDYSVNTDKQKTLTIDLGEAKESDIGEKTITFKASDDVNPEIVKTVTVKVIPATKENEKHNPTAETLEIGIKQELTDEAIKAKVKNYPSNATLTVKQKPDTDTTGNKTATVIVTYTDKSTDEVTVPVIVRDTTPPKIYWAKDDGSKVELGKTHAEGQNIVIPLYRGDEVNTRLITTDDSGKVTNFKMENLQSGFNFTPVSGTATEGSPLGQNVTGKVGLGVAKGKYTARAISTDGTNSTTGHFVFEVHEQAEKYTPAANTLIVPFNHKITDDEVKGKVIAKPGTPAFPNGTIFEVVSKPETNTTGTDKKAVVKITYPDKSTENIDVPVHVGKDLASQHPLEGHTVTVTVGDSLKTWRGRVDSNQYTNAPKGRGNGVEWGWKGTTPKVVQDTAGVFKYTATATHTDKSVAESNPQVTVIVKPKAPTIETDLTGKAELPNTAVVVNVHEGVKNGSIVTLYSQDGRAIGTGTVTNGKATITGTIPKGNITAKTTVQTPGEQDVTSDPSPEKVATTNKAGIYPIKGKTATVTVGDSLRQWNGRVDANQYTEAGPNGKGIGVEWGWEGTAPKILQDTAGVFKYTATATHTDKTVAKSDPKVTIIVKPKQPTIETDLTGKSNQENVPVTVSVGGGVKDGSTVTLYGPDGTTVIGTGTVTNGKATAIITGKVPVGNITAKTTVQTPGEDNVVSEPSPIKEATNIAPTAKTQTVGLNEKPNAKNSIGNNGDLPNGTNYTWKTTPDTSTPGDKPGVVTVTYPDGSTIDVPVTVKVTQVSDDYTPKYEDGSGKPGTSVDIP